MATGRHRPNGPLTLVRDTSGIVRGCAARAEPRMALQSRYGDEAETLVGRAHARVMRAAATRSAFGLPMSGTRLLRLGAGRIGGPTVVFAMNVRPNRAKGSIALHGLARGASSR